MSEEKYIRTGKVTGDNFAYASKGVAVTWNKEKTAGLGGGFVVTLTPDEEHENYANADKTFAEIWDAARAGMTIVAYTLTGDATEFIVPNPFTKFSKTDLGEGAYKYTLEFRSTDYEGTADDYPHLSVGE